MSKVHFEWDSNKDKLNQKKHNVPFSLARYAFLDPKRVIAEDLKHSEKEKRYYCIGCVNKDILTVRFTCRGSVVRIIGAGFWRKGKEIYEKNNKVH